MRLSEGKGRGILKKQFSLKLVVSPLKVVALGILRISLGALGE
jgi:hypothetical protein